MKTTTSITIDVEVLSELRRRKLPLSTMINGFLKSYLELPEDETKVEGEDINLKIASKESELSVLRKMKEKSEKKSEKKVKVRIHGEAHPYQR